MKSLIKSNDFKHAILVGVLSPLGFSELFNVHLYWYREQLNFQEMLLMLVTVYRDIWVSVTLDSFYPWKPWQPNWCPIKWGKEASFASSIIFGWVCDCQFSSFPPILEPRFFLYQREFTTYCNIQRSVGVMVASTPGPIKRSYHVMNCSFTHIHPTKINPSWIGEYTIPMENMGKVNHQPFLRQNRPDVSIHSYLPQKINGQKWFAMPHPKSVSNPGVFTTFHRRCFLFLPTPPVASVFAKMWFTVHRLFTTEMSFPILPWYAPFE